MGLGWSWRLGVVAGIPVRLHWSFGLLLIWIALPALADPIAWPLALAYSLLLLAMLTACVVLHELGHGLMARRLGVGVRDIVLLPIGGMARLEAPIGRAASARIAIALAGPAVNGALAAALLPLLWLVSGAFSDGPSALLREWGHLSPAGFVGAIVVANVALAGLNLLPIVPLDGGQAMRAALDRAIGGPATAHIMAVIGLATGAGLAAGGTGAEDMVAHRGGERGGARRRPGIDQSRAMAGGKPTRRRKGAWGCGDTASNCRTSRLSAGRRRSGRSPAPDWPA